MKIITCENGWIVVLQIGEELIASLNEFTDEQNLDSAWLTGLGAAGSATLGIHNPVSKDYEWKDFSGPLEIASLTGNLSKTESEPFWHLHVVLSSKDFAAVGGHIKQLVVGGTCEMRINKLGVTLARSFDENTGLKLL